LAWWIWRPTTAGNYYNTFLFMVDISLLFIAGKLTFEQSKAMQ